jgi:hypothetical protein
VIEVAPDTPPRFMPKWPGLSDATFFREDEHLWRLERAPKPSKLRATLPSAPRQQTLLGYRLSCTYRAGEPYRSMEFWYRKRADLQGLDYSKIPDLKSSDEADVAVDACPPTWGDALRAAWGPDGWQRYKDGVAATLENERLSRIRNAQDDHRKRQESMAAWAKGVAGRTPNSDAADLELARTVLADIDDAVRRQDELNSRPFQDRLDAVWIPKIEALAVSMLAKLDRIPSGPTGRAAFDNWDRQGGGGILSAIVRLYKIQSHRQERRLKPQEALSRDPDAALRERSSWGNVRWGVLPTIFSFYLEAYKERLANQPVLRTAFMKRVGDDLQRLRPSGDPGRQVVRFQPWEKKQSWAMTPQEQAQQNSIASDVTLGLMNMVGQMADLYRQLEKLDGDVRDSRAAFWRCYDGDCKNPGQTYYAYSYALMAKDQHLLLSKLAFTGSSGILAGMSFLGTDDIDGGFVKGCSTEVSELEETLGKWRKSIRGDVAQARVKLVEILQGPEYQRYESCRDLMEYAYRPRAPAGF